MESQISDGPKKKFMEEEKERQSSLGKAVADESDPQNLGVVGGAAALAKQRPLIERYAWPCVWGADQSA
jgi:hypothetical protein